ncbi:MAG TPA: hypothetical protein VLA89_07925 [Gemmatimonadales bacterium]|nr:hypothetical protein [Gemmatimonadales bacterium]
MSQREIKVGDPVRGRNPYTDEQVRGFVASIERSEIDGRDYAEVGGSIIAVANLIGPRPCNRPTPNEPWDGRCARCGREIWVNGPYDAESYTHDKSRVASRYL